MGYSRRSRDGSCSVILAIPPSLTNRTKISPTLELSRFPCVTQNEKKNEILSRLALKPLLPVDNIHL